MKSFGWLFSAIALFAATLAVCKASDATVNPFVCCAGVAALPALWVIASKQELFFAMAFPLTLSLIAVGGPHVGGPVGYLSWLAWQWGYSMPLLTLAVVLAIPATLFLLAACWPRWARPLKILAGLLVMLSWLYQLRRSDLPTESYLTHVPLAFVMLVLGLCLAFSFADRTTAEALAQVKE